MQWSTPDFVEINLSGEVTAYANTDGEVRSHEFEFVRCEPVGSTSERAAEAAA